MALTHDEIWEQADIASERAASIPPGTQATMEAKFEALRVESERRRRLSRPDPLTTPRVRPNS
jgi:hypothetical protein